MRIIGGQFRSRNIIYPENENKVRPTKDRVREAVFSILQYEVVDKDILDCFAGSGAYGLESISRGAKGCVFIDCYDDSIRCIKENIKNLKITNATILNSDYNLALKQLADQNTKFDLIFLDPPYKFDVYNQIIDYLLENNMLKENAIFVLESDHVLNLDEFNDIFRIKHYKYGKNFIAILRKL